ncbi:hypothetical protein CSOJ01_10074 [Colletotrichum sojae]|uniref:Uncharacterized protein n=1 Tax=Colletotrichum sojae TaxID=2175907 RepID=A0A8H6MPV8_9PEZI|nr:hypothetical protein CSOJ01_10074 [Colletotrichum sojae]
MGWAITPILSSLSTRPPREDKTTSRSNKSDETGDTVAASETGARLQLSCKLERTESRPREIFLARAASRDTALESCSAISGELNSLIDIGLDYHRAPDCLLQPTYL